VIETKLVATATHYVIMSQNLTINKNNYKGRGRFRPRTKKVWRKKQNPAPSVAATTVTTTATTKVKPTKNGRKKQVWRKVNPSRGLPAPMSIDKACQSWEEHMSDPFSVPPISIGGSGTPNYIVASYTCAQIASIASLNNILFAMNIGSIASGTGPVASFSLNVAAGDVAYSGGTIVSYVPFNQTQINSIGGTFRPISAGVRVTVRGPSSATPPILMAGALPADASFTLMGAYKPSQVLSSPLSVKGIGECYAIQSNWVPQDSRDINTFEGQWGSGPGDTTAPFLAVQGFLGAVNFSIILEYIQFFEAMPLTNTQIGSTLAAVQAPYSANDMWSAYLRRRSRDRVTMVIQNPNVGHKHGTKHGLHDAPTERPEAKTDSVVAHPQFMQDPDVGTSVLGPILSSVMLGGAYIAKRALVPQQGVYEPAFDSPANGGFACYGCSQEIKTAGLCTKCHDIITRATISEDSSLQSIQDSPVMVASTKKFPKVVQINGNNGSATNTDDHDVEMKAEPPPDPPPQSDPYGYLAPNIAGDDYIQALTAYVGQPSASKYLPSSRYPTVGMGGVPNITANEDDYDDRAVYDLRKKVPGDLAKMILEFSGSLTPTMSLSTKEWLEMRRFEFASYVVDNINILHGVINRNTPCFLCNEYEANRYSNNSGSYGHFPECSRAVHIVYKGVMPECAGCYECSSCGTEHNHGCSESITCDCRLFLWLANFRYEIVFQEEWCSDVIEEIHAQQSTSEERGSASPTMYYKVIVDECELGILPFQLERMMNYLTTDTHLCKYLDDCWTYTIAESKEDDTIPHYMERKLIPRNPIDLQKYQAEMHTRLFGESHIIGDQINGNNGSWTNSDDVDMESKYANAVFHADVPTCPGPVIITPGFCFKHRVDFYDKEGCFICLNHARRADDMEPTSTTLRLIDPLSSSLRLQKEYNPISTEPKKRPPKRKKASPRIQKFGVLDPETERKVRHKSIKKFFSPKSRTKKGVKFRKVDDFPMYRLHVEPTPKVSVVKPTVVKSKSVAWEPVLPFVIHEEIDNNDEDKKKVQTGPAVEMEDPDTNLISSKGTRKVLPQLKTYMLDPKKYSRYHLDVKGNMVFSPLVSTIWGEKKREIRLPVTLLDELQVAIHSLEELTEETFGVLQEKNLRLLSSLQVSSDVYLDAMRWATPMAWEMCEKYVPAVNPYSTLPYASGHTFYQNHELFDVPMSRCLYRKVRISDRRYKNDMDQYERTACYHLMFDGSNEQKLMNATEHTGCPCLPRVDKYSIEEVVEHFKKDGTQLDVVDLRRSLRAQYKLKPEHKTMKVRVAKYILRKFFPKFFTVVSQISGNNGSWTGTDDHKLDTVPLLKPVALKERSKYLYKGEANDKEGKQDCLLWDSKYRPMCFANTRQNEEATLRNRVCVKTPDTDTDYMTRFVKFVKRNFRRIMNNKVFQVQPVSAEEYLERSNASPSVKKVLEATYVDLDDECISSDSSLDRKQLYDYTTRSLFLKKENLCYRTPYGVKEKCPRAIQGAPARFICLTGPWFMALQDLVKKTWNSKNWVSMACGISARDAASVIDKPWKFWEDDISAFDSSVSIRLLNLECWIAKQYGAPQAVFDLMKANNQTHGRTFQGASYEVPDGRKSGDPFTTLFNSMLNALMHMFVIHDQLGWSVRAMETRCAMLVAGDDNALAINTDKRIDFVAGMLKLGFKSEAIERHSIYDLEFCSCRVYDIGEYKLFGPMPGKVLSKIGVVNNLPLGVTVESVLRGVALGLMGSCYYLPPIRVVVDRILALTEGHRVHITQETRFKNYEWNMNFVNPAQVDNSKVMCSLLDTYGWTPKKQRFFELAVSTVRLGDMFNNPSYLLLCGRDTAGPMAA